MGELIPDIIPDEKKPDYNDPEEAWENEDDG